jgi:hypothetical protein
MGLFTNSKGKTNTLGVLGRIGAGLVTGGLSEAAIGGYNLAKDQKYNVAGFNPFPKPVVNPRKEMVARLAQENAMLKEDPNKLGLSDQQKSQMVDAATAQTSAKMAGQNSELAKIALSGQGFQQGAFAEQAREAQKGVAETQAAAQAQAEAMHLQKIEQARDRIMQGLAAERMTRRQNRQYWANYGLSAGTSIASMFLNPGGILNGGGGGGGGGDLSVPPPTAQNTAMQPIYSDPSALLRNA